VGHLVSIHPVGASSLELSHLPNFWFEWLYLKLKEYAHMNKRQLEARGRNLEIQHFSISVTQAKTSVAHILLDECRISNCTEEKVKGF